MFKDKIIMIVIADIFNAAIVVCRIHVSHTVQMQRACNSEMD